MREKPKICGLCVFFDIRYSAPDFKGVQKIYPCCKVKNKDVSPNGTCMNFKRKEQNNG